MAVLWQWPYKEDLAAELFGACIPWLSNHGLILWTTLTMSVPWTIVLGSWSFQLVYVLFPEGLCFLSARISLHVIFIQRIPISDIFLEWCLASWTVAQENSRLVGFDLSQKIHISRVLMCIICCRVIPHEDHTLSAEFLMTDTATRHRPQHPFTNRILTQKQLKGRSRTPSVTGVE